MTCGRVNFCLCYLICILVYTWTAHGQDIIEDISLSDNSSISAITDAPSNAANVAGDDQPKVCEWNISAEAGRLKVAWSGNATTNSNVTITAKLYEDSEPGAVIYSVFSHDHAYLELIPNEQYEINIEFGDCEVKESKRKFWSPPGPPENVTFIDVKNISFTVTWKKPSGSGEIGVYNIKVTAGETVVLEQFTKATSMNVPNLNPYTVYSVQVSATNQNFSGNYSSEQKKRTAVGVPHAPFLLQPTEVGNTTVSLKWEEPTPSTGRIEGYTVSWVNSSPPDWGSSSEVNTSSSDTSYTMERLTPYVNYTFRVLAWTSAGPGSWSKEIPVQTDIGIPHAPVLLEPTEVGNTTVNLKWEEPTPSTGRIERYTVSWVNSSPPDWGSSSEVNTSSSDAYYTIQRLTPYVNYTFRVLAWTSAGPGSWSNEMRVQTDIGIPHPPNNLKFSDVTNTSVLLTWQEPDPSTGPIKTYTVRWKSSTDEKGENVVSVGDVLSYSETDLLPYVNYTFDVKAETDAGSGEFSESVQFRTEIGVPHPPTNLTYSDVTDTSALLTWGEPVPSTGPINWYTLRWYSSKDENGTQVLDYDVQSYNATNLLPYVNYTFDVRAETDAGNGSWSDRVQFRTEIGVPYPPINLTCSDVTNTSALLTWKEPDPATGPIKSYTVRWNSSRSNGSEIVGPDVLRFNATDLLPFVDYAFDVKAETKAGQGNWAESVTFKTGVGVPHAPTSLIAPYIGNTSADLQWEKPEVSTGPIKRYRVFWESDSGSGEEDTVSDRTNHTLERLTPFVNYTLKVLAITKAGPGEWSDNITIETAIGIPYPPANLTHSDVTNTSALLTWGEPVPVTGPVKAYIVRWESSKHNGTEVLNSDVLTYKATDLLPFVEYTFDVKAETDAGQGDWSTSVKFRTKIGVPYPPANLTYGDITNTSAVLTWLEPATFTGSIKSYTVRWYSSRDSVYKQKVLGVPRILRYEATGLLPYVNYTFDVRAETEAGHGNWSKSVEFRTKVGVPHPPAYLGYTEVTNTSVRLTWREPDPHTGPITSYTVRWDSSRDKGTKRVAPEFQYHNITELLPYTDYSFDVKAETVAGESDWSKSENLTTKDGVPTAPRNLAVLHATNVSMDVKWNRPEFPNARQISYNIHWREEKGTHSGSARIEMPTDAEEIDHTISGLLPYTFYLVEVRGITKPGAGPLSNVVLNRTQIGEPKAAKILEVSHSRKRAVRVIWKTEGVYPGPVQYSLQAWKSPGPCSDRVGEYSLEKARGSLTREEWSQEFNMEATQLSPAGTYYFQVMLRTEVTDGIPSPKSITIRISPEAASEPTDVKAECTGSPTELKLSWKTPDEPNGIIHRYRIKYGLEALNETKLLEVENKCGKQNSFVLRGLRPERRYRISIAANVQEVYEDGKPGEPKQVCTLPAGIPLLGDVSRISAESEGHDCLTLEWSKDTFSDYMGAIVRYAVLVGRAGSLGNSTSGTSATDGPPWLNFSTGVSDFYQATPPEWNPFQNASDPLQCESSLESVNGSNKTVLHCLVGVQKECPQDESYCNGPLQPDTQYEMKIRAFTRGGYTETDLIYAHSRPAPKPSPVGTIAAVLVVLLLLVFLGAGGYVAKKKGYLNVLVNNVQARLHPKEEPKRESVGIQMEECKKPRPILTKLFFEHVKLMMNDSHLKFSLEFETLKNESPQLPCVVAESEENRPKNRWMNIFPFDITRVKLLPLCDEPGSDFINANYIPGYSSPREYIATQGPLPHTVDDFWRMVWEQSVNMIVMLTQCIERGKKKCEKYWPDSGETQYSGDLRITCVSESILSSYVIRIFHIQLGSYERHVKQMHFTHWPDFGCPETPEDLINFVNAVRDHLPRSKPGPILVHCSAGVGRTGTFIAVDRLSLRLRNAPNPGEDTVDVYGTVLELRNHRTNMVQTEDQYIYIHLCVRQLIRNRERSQASGSEENIYSNIGMERDTHI